MTRETATALMGNLAGRLQALFQTLSEPRLLARVQAGVVVLMVIWGANSAARLLWSLWPSPQAQPSDTVVINPVKGSQGVRRQVSVDLEAMLGLGLFGDPVNEVAEVEAPVNTDTNPRDGIEDGARESRLDLKLTGVVASTEDGLGSAVIETKGSQISYSVGDALPASGKVTLAKVMATQVVIDNNGTYELLTLFEEGGLSSALAASQKAAASSSISSLARQAQSSASSTRSSVRISDRDSAALAASYRDKLYDNPQSLAQVVKVSAVRGPEGLKGYRVAPGKDVQQFRALGFKSGDIVTAVNGLPLSDPTNTMRLYQLMRDATEATFDVERDGGVVSIAVSLSETQ